MSEIWSKSVKYSLRTEYAFLEPGTQGSVVSLVKLAQSFAVTVKPLGKAWATLQVPRLPSDAKLWLGICI